MLYKFYASSNDDDKHYNRSQQKRSNDIPQNSISWFLEKYHFEVRHDLVGMKYLIDGKTLYLSDSERISPLISSVGDSDGIRS
jgi:hypothetical protein